MRKRRRKKRRKRRRRRMIKKKRRRRRKMIRKKMTRNPRKMLMILIRWRMISISLLLGRRLMPDQWMIWCPKKAEAKENSNKETSEMTMKRFAKIKMADS
jgi:hypothetical protein